MGRLLYELGRMDEKRRIANERGSSKMGKSSFSWAWELDGTLEERERWASFILSENYALIFLFKRYYDGYCSAITQHSPPQNYYPGRAGAQGLRT